MNKQHTPKPWGITSRNWSFRIQPQSNDPAENEANIRLIRVAPELLEALEECVTSYGATCFRESASADEMRRRLVAINGVAVAAIAKARGNP